jgi:type IV pilus assembly protein PilA
MVVVLIIAILIAVAIPAFLGAQNRARDRSAQSALRDAFTAAKAIAVGHEGIYKTAPGPCTDDGALMAAALETENASLAYVSGGTSSDSAVSVHLVENCRTILLQRKSSSGTNYCILAKQDGTLRREVSEQGADFTELSCDQDAEW